MTINFKEKVRGCLFGGAIGDALGYKVEFKSLSSIRASYGEQGIKEPEETNGQFVVSDDTQMVMFTLEGLTRGLGKTDETILEEIRLAYIDWLSTQSPPEIGWKSRGEICNDKRLWFLRAPGNTCLSASRTGAHGTLTKPINDSKGCGGVMRSAPLGLVKTWSPQEAFNMGCRVAAITHGHPSGYLSAGALSCLICHLINGKHIREALTETLPLLEKSDGGEETLDSLTKAIDLSSSKDTDIVEGISQLGEGWTGEEALAIAVYAVLRASNFQEAVTIAANHDGDSDSTASIAGQLYGAWYGDSALPASWIDKLDIKELMIKLADSFIERHIPATK
jgi:ADP-ribosylglycohydrolase